MPVIETRSLHFLDFLQYPDMQVPAEKTTFLTGPSGSGKTTLFRLFNGTLSPSGGSILYGGADIAQIDTLRLRREVLLVSQMVYLFPGTIAENFGAYYQYRGQTPPGTEEMRRCLDLCLADFSLDTEVQTMSGGERQRIYNALYLSFRPRVLMLDEPTSALDTGQAFEMMENLKTHCAAQGTTLLVISHDPSLVARLADHTISLQGGSFHE